MTTKKGACEIREIMRLEATIDRLDNTPDSEVDSDFYAECLHELVSLRKVRDAEIAVAKAAIRQTWVHRPRIDRKRGAAREGR